MRKALLVGIGHLLIHGQQVNTCKHVPSDRQQNRMLRFPRCFGGWFHPLDISWKRTLVRCRRTNCWGAQASTPTTFCLVSHRSAQDSDPSRGLLTFKSSTVGGLACRQLGWSILFPNLEGGMRRKCCCPNKLGAARGRSSGHAFALEHPC